MKRMLALGPESPGRPERGERGCASEVDRAVVVTQERVVGWYQQTLDGSFSAVSKPNLQVNIRLKVLDAI